jgi:hypothetical protein
MLYHHASVSSPQRPHLSPVGATFCLGGRARLLCRRADARGPLPAPGLDKSGPLRSFSGGRGSTDRATVERPTTARAVPSAAEAPEGESTEMVQQVAAHHLSRLACLSVRQRTLQPVFEHTESTARQYALQERARALGWAEEHIIVIDQDLGHSGTSPVDRLGFQWLVAEVGLGRVGLVLGLEVSRLARNSSDWHHLLPNLRAHPDVDPG